MLKPYSTPKVIPVRIYTHLKLFGTLLLGNLENVGPNAPIHGKWHIKVMKSLQLNISHPTMPSSSCFKVIWGSSVIQYLSHCENLGSLDPQIKLRKSFIESHCRCLTQLLMLNETSLRPSEEWLIIPVLLYLGIGASQGKNPSKGHGYTEIHP